MKIILNTGSVTDLETIKEFLNFNIIDYTEFDLFDSQLDTFGRNTLNHSILKEDKTLLIVNYITFEELYSWSVSRQEMIDFCQQGNYIWVWHDMDSLIRTSKMYTVLPEFDRQVPKGKISLFIDGTPEPQSIAYTLSNIDIKIVPNSFYLGLMRIGKGSITKTNCERDFMLTMGHQRVHRDVLWSKLNAKPDLLARGTAIYHRLSVEALLDPNNQQALDYENNWIGARKKDGKREDHRVSISLYNNSWIEVVPETLYDRGFFFTEKTAKPISTKTPFLALSTPGYLNYLHGLGFKTFNRLISEEYDLEPNLETRVDMLVKQLEDIVNNGAEEFYHACKPILDYNHNKLAEHKGLWNCRMDLFISENLEQIGIK